MKRSILPALLTLFFFSAARACDICGCGVGNFNPYMFPQLSRNFFSISWQHRCYLTHFIENGETVRNKEYYNTLSLAAQFSPMKNLQVMVVIPFQLNRQSGTEGYKSLNRPGDLVLMTNYRFFDHKGSASLPVRQSLLLGCAVKFATGDHRFNDNNEKEVGNSNFQAGTGSTDYLLNAYYSLRYRSFAFSSGINYKMNGSNREGYRFGNRLQSVTQVKYIGDLGKVSLIPSFGLMTETMKQDKQSGLVVDGNRTGGFNTQLLVGLDLNTRRFAIGLSCSGSIDQHLAGGQIYSRPGFSIHLGYSL